MKPNKIIAELGRNKSVFESLLEKTEAKIRLWKQKPDKWCLLEIVCHLYDEEREDFRVRIKHCFENPELPLPPIDPVGWVKDREYIKQNFNDKLKSFLKEREISENWLESLENPDWEKSLIHPSLGKMKARMFLANWLAHDHIHIRQINNVKYDYLNNFTDDSLGYAGNW